jgi:hypothetical protein
MHISKNAVSMCLDVTTITPTAHTFVLSVCVLKLSWPISMVTTVHCSHIVTQVAPWQATAAVAMAVVTQLDASELHSYWLGWMMSSTFNIILLTCRHHKQAATGVTQSRAAHAYMLLVLQTRHMMQTLL